MHRHGIPDAPGFKSGHSHDQLTAWHTVGLNILANGSFVAQGRFAELNRLGFSERNFGCRIIRVGGRTIEIEPGRVAIDGTGKFQIFSPHTDV